jgi:hypothetical protein
VAVAVAALPGVAGLSAGPDGLVATHGPGERVEGVRLLASERGLVGEVRVVLDTFALYPTAERVREAAARAAAGAGQSLERVDVFIDDVRSGGPLR